MQLRLIYVNFLGYYEGYKRGARRDRRQMYGAVGERVKKEISAVRGSLLGLFSRKIQREKTKCRREFARCGRCHLR